MHRVVIFTFPALSVAHPSPSHLQIVRSNGAACTATTPPLRLPAGALAKVNSASRCALVARSSTMKIARAGADCLRPSVSFAETTARTPRPSTLVPAMEPESTFQARTAFLPVMPVSALAKHEPANTSQVRASTYSPRTVADGPVVIRIGKRNRQVIGSPPDSVRGTRISPIVQ